MKTVKIAMIGVGCISGIYLENITKTFKEIELIGVCDLIRASAQRRRRLTTASRRSMIPCTMRLQIPRSISC